MDHDDSDFQSQNFQLVGEDSNRFPSGLRPFALPKLDIEDQLQGHLRFDNLIDSEAFFSVQGHESNWIEVLSTGSSVVDFSSSAAESCSKTNNVWSEATSTESVEMLLKSVGEIETTGNMDSNAHLQLSAMDSQIDQSNVHPDSTSSPTDSTVVPTEKDQSQSTHSRMTDGPDHSQSTHSRMAADPSNTDPQLERFAPFLMDKKSEQAAASVAEKCIASEKLSSSINTSGSCPAVGGYFEGVQDDLSLDKLNVPSAEVNSRNLNNEPFTGLAPLQNIYVTDSYHFEQDNKESEVDVAPQDSEVCHFNENKVEGGLTESLGTVNLSSQVSNETLLPESSDGLLEAITNPLKLHRSDGTCNIVNSTLQLSFSPVQHETEGLSSSVDRSNELIINEFGVSSNSAPSHRSEADSRNSNPHLVSSLSPKRKVADATGVPEETMNAGANSTNISCTGDESKLEVLEHNKDSVDNLESGAMEEKTMDKIPVVSGNMEQMVENNHEENASGATDTSKDKVESSDSIAPENSSADAFNASEDPKIPSINHEGSFNECDTPGIEEEPESSHLVLSTSGPHEKMSAPVISSSSGIGITSTTVTDTFGTPADKNGCSIGVSAADSSALPDERDLIVSTMNHEVPSKEGAKSALGDEDNNVISPGSEPGGVMSAVPVDSNTDVYGSTVSVAKKEEYTEQANSLGGSTTAETQDKSGNHPDASSPKCQTDKSLIQGEQHTDPATPPALGISSGNVAEKVVETPQNASNDLNARVQADAVLNHGTDHSPGTVTSQGKVGSSIVEPGNGNGIRTSATCGSPSVISCSEPSPQEGGQGSNALLHHTPLDVQSGDPKDCEANADAAQSSKQCSTRNLESALGSEETNTAGGDRSFSFEVGAPPNASEKAHSPVWSPFPRYTASQSTEMTPENPQPGSSLKSISDVSKETSIAKAGKEQLSERKVAESAGGPSDNSNIGDSTKSSSSPPEKSQQHPTPEPSDLVKFPFTDPQHLQLRAQIFVYGALIQGTPPGEAYMVAAFGESGGGGKPTWEAAWRAALERFQYQKSLYTGLETPTSSRIGSSVPDKANKSTAVRTAPASKKGGKTVVPAHSTATLHGTFSVPLGSSTFNLQRGTHLDFSQAVSPFTYNSHMRQSSPGVAPWYTQSPGPRPAPWLIPPQNLIFDSSMQAAGPTNETAKGASSKIISISHTVSPVLVPPSSAPSIVSSAAVVNDEKQKAPASSSKKGTASQKPRKRKKASASPEQQSVIASPQLKADVTSSIPATNHTSGFTLSTHSPSNALVSRVVPNTGQLTSIPNYQITGGMDSEQGIIFSEQIRSAIEQSTVQAKGASMHSVEAVRHKEGIWSHLSTISKNKLPREVEEKLTSAAAAAEAAVSVAKAAAEAAKMASEAALQAKMMAEEALSSSTSLKSMHHEAGEVGISSNPPGQSSSTPASSLKSKENSRTPGSILSVARKAARKRVEEASAATKRAENLDAILKAAEFAAEAVFRAGTIIGMGEPLPFTLRELLEAGPDGYWKSESVRNKAGSGNHNPVTETLEVDAPANFSKSGRKRGRKPKYDQALPNSEPSSSGKELLPEGIHSANVGHGVEDVPTTMALDSNKNSTAPVNIIWNGIEKGSAVEVLSDKGGFGVAWFSAKVVDINENNTFVSYHNHNGTGPHEEQVPLRQDGDKPPQIRLPYPATLSKFKTRKRRRETAGSCLWVIGDHVDAWVNDSWREGVIAQNYEGDETKYVVQFSVGGGGESLVVDAWNLRPSRVWKDGQWTEWSSARERKSKSNKGDSPLEKRQRTDLLQAGGDLSTVGEAGGPSKDKNTNNTKKPEELKQLALSQEEMVFNVGKSVVENKSDALAFKRPGLQKEGSKVVYGVPKHGKKKKFMEVSKHYDVGQSDKISEGNASSRFAKHSMPQLPRPRENTSKVDHNRGRRVAEMRSRIPKPTKSQNVAANSVPDEDSLPKSIPNSGVSERSFTLAESNTSTSNTKKPTVEKNNSALGTGPRTVVPSVSEMQPAYTDPTSKQNVSTNNRAKRKYVPPVGNVNRSTLRTCEKTSSDSGEPQRTSSDSAEPRRSNRRIQPTSRLLEGLQSSLIISKVPGEKVPRSNYKSASSRGRAHG
ncbi:mucin-12-like isoform X6 [Panicum virgatum]|uniref:mucin-12-like isoform X6 n=1 Tax=Panicum virgatum TaxID=38727 RepID=UPI0019D51CC6|nr:mucin-12-like isoform X6 [Panicum virgatum]